MGTLNSFGLWSEGRNIDLALVNYREVLDYIGSRRQGLSRGSLGTEVTALRHYYDHLLEEGVVEENPVGGVVLRGIRRKRLYDVLSGEELVLLHRNYGEEQGDKAIADLMYRNKVMLGMLVYQGLDVYSLKRLEVDDVDLEQGQVMIRGSKRTECRVLKLTSVQILGLHEYVKYIRGRLLYKSERQAEQVAQLFISVSGSVEIRNVLSNLVHDLRRANGRVKSLRQIRASVIVDWLKRYNLREVQYMAGHRYVSSTESYRAHNVEALSKDMDVYHPLQK